MKSSSYKSKDFRSQFSCDWEQVTRPFKPLKLDYYVRRDSQSQSVVKGRSKNEIKKKNTNIII